MSGGRLGAVAVTDAEGGLLGIITDGDLRRMLEKYEDVDGLKARDIMSVSPKNYSGRRTRLQRFPENGTE